MIAARRELLVREVGQRITTPQAVGCQEQIDSAVQLTGGSHRSAVRRLLLEPSDVDRIGRKLQGVAVAAHDDQVSRSQCATKLGHEPLQPVAYRGRRVGTPQRVDQSLSRNHPADMQRQNSKERTQLRTSDRHVASRDVEHFELAQQTDVHARR